jgi:pyrimidine operon attenuation protein/uracil phosphoribosyltransferase
MSETTLRAAAGGVRSMIDSMIREIIQKQPNKSLLGIVGIQTRGAVLARRIKFILDRELKTNIPFGALDITFYRDDLQKISSKPLVRSTEIEFNLNDRHVILVDDVLYTGRTVRAALDEIMDFGRPAMIRLAVLVDRGHRELLRQYSHDGNRRRGEGVLQGNGFEGRNPDIQGRRGEDARPQAAVLIIAGHVEDSER